MSITPRVVKSAAQGTAGWGSGVQSAGNKWADGYANPSRSPFDPAVINPDAWQAGVSTASAKHKYAANLAGVDQNVVLATVNGAGKGKYVASGSTKQAKYAKFASTFYPKLGSILQGLPKKGPRGTNRGRLNAYLDAVQATRNTNT